MFPENSLFRDGICGMNGIMAELCCGPIIENGLPPPPNMPKGSDRSEFIILFICRM